MKDVFEMNAEEMAAYLQPVVEQAVKWALDQAALKLGVDNGAELEPFCERFG